MAAITHVGAVPVFRIVRSKSRAQSPSGNVASRSNLSPWAASTSWSVRRPSCGPRTNRLVTSRHPRGSTMSPPSASSGGWIGQGNGSRSADGTSVGSTCTRNGFPAAPGCFRYSSSPSRFRRLTSSPVPRSKATLTRSLASPSTSVVSMTRVRVCSTGFGAACGRTVCSRASAISRRRPSSTSGSVV